MIGHITLREQILTDSSSMDEMILFKKSTVQKEMGYQSYYSTFTLFRIDMHSPLVIREKSGVLA